MSIRAFTFGPLKEVSEVRQLAAVAHVLNEIVWAPYILDGNEVTVHAHIHPASLESGDEVSDVMVSLKTKEKEILYRVGVDMFGQNCITKNFGDQDGNLDLRKRNGEDNAHAEWIFTGTFDNQENEDDNSS